MNLREFAMRPGKVVLDTDLSDPLGEKKVSYVPHSWIHPLHLSFSNHHPLLLMACGGWWPFFSSM
jgi:hypothetical protein